MNIIFIYILLSRSEAVVKACAGDSASAIKKTHLSPCAGRRRKHAERLFHPGHEKVSGKRKWSAEGQQ